METVAIIGCGNLGRSIAEGLADMRDQYRVIATRRNIAAIRDLEKKGVEVTSDNVAAVMAADIVLLVVKPYNVDSILAEVKSALKGQIVVSAASGVTISMMRKQVGEDMVVFRAMPNTATLVKESITCICADNGSTGDFDRINGLFACIGQTATIREDLMEAATVLGACGIAYVMRFIRAMTQGGIQIGFSAELASLIASQTVKGAAELLLSGSTHPESEIDKVTTPKGCTIVGLNEMEHAGFSSSLIKGIVSSYNEIVE